MLVWRCKPPGVPFLLSLGTFVKHLSVIEPKAFPLHRIKAKSLTTAAAIRTHNSSCFDSFSCRQKKQIRLYVDTLLQWNQKMNLTAVTDVDEVMERHIEDSLAILPPIQDSYVSHCNASIDSIKLVDVGTGAGLPGLVLAIACPAWKVTLLESMNKRCDFLEHAVSVTGLSNVEVVRGRAENLGQNVSFREKFDVAVARAVAEMRILAEYCLPLVRVGGLFIAPKGHDPQEEVRNAEKVTQIDGLISIETVLRYYCCIISSVESRSPYGQRTAIICSKDRPTPRKYPRDPGTPAKLPL